MNARLLLLGLLLAGGCASGGGAGGGAGGPSPGSSIGPQGAEVDSATVLLWRMDETAGTRIANAGGGDFEGTAGTETRPELGRVHGARRFTRSVDSFVWSAAQPALEASAAMTIEAWIRLDAFGQYEDTPIASRWNPVTADQSWLFAVGGRNTLPPFAALPSPGYHADLLPSGATNRLLGRLMFAFQPERAGQARAYFSNVQLELDRWIHVAATFDSKVVRLFINGRLDAQYAVSDGIRPSAAPLLVGNLFDPRALTSIGGDLRLDTSEDQNPYYAFEGSIDDLRLSRVAREEFPHTR